MIYLKKNKNKCYTVVYAVCYFKDSALSGKIQVKCIGILKIKVAHDYYYLDSYYYHNNMYYYYSEDAPQEYVIAGIVSVVQQVRDQGCFFSFSRYLS